MEKEKREQESCTSCAYRKDWYCPVAGDRVKREGSIFQSRKARRGDMPATYSFLPLFPKYRLRFFPFGLRANLPLISALHGYCLYAL